MEVFLEILRGAFRARLISLLLYGSAAFDDLAPGYGDLDFLAIVSGDLREQECRELIELREPLRDGSHGTLAAMLEGPFLPRPMLDPSRAGKALWWGTTGERVWDHNELGWLALHGIRERGIIVWGEDIRPEIPVAGRDALLDDVRSACQAMHQHGRGGSLHSVDWLLTAARLLLWLREGRLSAKSEAAEWGCAHAAGEWRRLLPRARQIRLHPASASPPEAQAWLDALDEPIQAACGEVECELARYV
jgi:hypothetical protein